MKEQLEKIIEKHYDPDTETLESGKIAEEIESFVFEFMDWAKENCRTVDATHAEEGGYWWNYYKTDYLKYTSKALYNLWFNTIKSAIQMLPVTSSQIKSIGFDKDTLYIEFHQGTVYIYKGVPQEIFDMLCLAKSVGKYFAEAIKGKYEYVKTDKVVVNGEIK